MAMDKKRYPKDWDEISKRIRFQRAGGKCEQCGAINGEPNPLTGSKVVLTVHHIGVDYPDGTPGDMHDKMDCRDENLIALCQRCHLLADLPSHMAHAKETRQRKKAEARASVGQLGLFDEARNK